ncbi:PEP-CTERM sorting domain-containing protein [Sphingomonas psychrotolerans]|uniref:PEP-CTERM sorting domain-containing protein n=1 Tax=Sphingomonas psychrotolerans TaxID=1327635 RepID=A0ABU3N485_9SPHN|nr:VIT domain-containing protein [Sphingomonas psychrotolerans]MDT8759342.1 PEP-CTERM sorting domain-containing protein [Sphingomonas psychrotolerans]
MSYSDRYKPRIASLIIASIFPAIVIVVEFATGLCASAFFDPMPTIGHLLLIALVPIINFLLWQALQRDDVAPAWLLVAGGVSIAIAASYSLLFLPMLPFALVAILFLGIGLLPFAPVAGLVLSMRWTNEAASLRTRGWRSVIGGFALGVFALLLVDLPATITEIALDRYRGDAEDRRSAVALMRALGDRDMLLRQSYGDTARASGVASFLVSGWSFGVFRNEERPTGAARELYYRVTGKAFNAVPRPRQGVGDRARLFAWDDDRGGEEVGGRVPNLALTGSRIDGSVAARDNLAYVEWTIDLANSGEAQQEARFTVALPEGAVATRATLWVNGEPREASIAGRGETRAAYAAVVNASRDPLLITTDGAQRLLVQAFPIQPDATMRLRIGVTAPFAIAPDGRRTLALPAIVERNFDLASGLRHAVWIEGPETTRTMLPDSALLAGRFRIGLPQVTTPTETLGGVPAQQGGTAALTVTQRIERVAAPRGPVMLVVDSSADMTKIATALPPALAAIAPGRMVGLMVAGDAPRLVAVRPWSLDQAARIRTALAEIRFRGGQDDRAALAAALQALPRADATLLWLHGAQPVRFTSPEPALEQALDRLPGLPRLVRYQVTPGRAMTLEGNRWFDGAQFPSPSGDLARDLRALLTNVAGDVPRWSVVRAPVAGGTPTGSPHIVRLWAAEKLAGQRISRGKEREAGIALAHRLNIVTPISGAVVLETNRDYGANGLPVPDPDAVPTVPEPETWALLILIALASAWLLKRQRGLAGATA